RSSDQKKEVGISYLFISHDLSVVRHICNLIAVMCLGKLMEVGDRKDIFQAPTHPYTQAVLSAIPTPNPWDMVKKKEIVVEGDIHSPANPLSGTRFRTRSWKAQDVFRKEEPELLSQSCGHLSACHFAEVDKTYIPTSKEARI